MSPEQLENIRKLAERVANIDTWGNEDGADSRPQDLAEWTLELISRYEDLQESKGI